MRCHRCNSEFRSRPLFCPQCGQREPPSVRWRWAPVALATTSAGALAGAALWWWAGR